MRPASVDEPLVVTLPEVDDELLDELVAVVDVATVVVAVVVTAVVVAVDDAVSANANEKLRPAMASMATAVPAPINVAFIKFR